ncbi:MAG TPA: hypothetical protein VG323_01885 [Thermoanaerobaculia bacterium]|nr:hypothetical protein [Thermoanaerobaculia bacterium]
MPGWLKILLIIAALFVVVIVVISIVAWHSLQAHGPELKASMEKARDEGAAYGAGKASGDCVDEALRRGDRSFTGQVRTRLFADACLKASTRPPGYCDPVPSGIVATAKWANEQCLRRNLGGDQLCVQLYTAVGDYCHPAH